MRSEPVTADSEERIIVGNGMSIAGVLSVPQHASALIVFAHGSGSGRHSPRNRFVAGVLNRAKCATLLMDLLTPGEELLDASTGRFRFNIELLGQRLSGASEWILTQKALRHLPVGYFGASTGAAAALIAAARQPRKVFAVVSRGGRPDLAGEALRAVKAPTLLVVGGDDATVLDLNRQAAQLMTGEVRMEIIPHATHLFEEPGALEHVALLAQRWFHDHLPEKLATANAKELP